MAKVYSKSGVFPKRFEEFVIYPLGEDIIIREVSGFTTEALLKSPKYANCRSNASEFGRVSRLCRQLREQLSDVLPKGNNLAVCNSLTAVMRKAMTFDTVSERGARNLATAFNDNRARQLLTDYDFNPDHRLHDVMQARYCYDPIRSRLCFGAFRGQPKITFPQTANRVGLRLHQLRFDFENGEGALLSSELVVCSKDCCYANIVLECAEPNGKGVLFSILELQFYWFEEGSYMPVAGKVLKVVGVDINEFFH